jgi:hypothetical protein
MGCAATPYKFGSFHRPGAEPAACSAVVIEQGKPNATLDRIARIVGAPARIVPMNCRINKHEICAETTEKLTDYLEKNDLADVRVYVNHYDPAGQWQRLRDNTMISPGWRYSVGTLSWLGYTIFPDRIYGGDRYNPYTNSLYLNSDVPAVILNEAASAKDIHSRHFPGAYAVFTSVPGLSLWRKSRAIGDVLGYAQLHHDWEMERQAYHVLCPRMGAESTSIAGPLTHIWWGGPICGLGGAAVGHLTGRTLAKRREPAAQATVTTGLATGNAAADDKVHLAGFVEEPPQLKLGPPLIERLPQ